MTNQNMKPAGSLPTTWELRTYDVWGNARDGYDVNDSYSAGTVELRIPQTRYNVGVEWHVCRNPECPGNNPCGHNPPCAFGTHRRESHGVIPTTTHNSETGDTRQRCPECWQDATLQSQEFIGAFPTDRQIKWAFGVTCRIDTDGDDLFITVNRARDGYPIGEMHCTSHASLSPVRKLETK
jgi:hypothetical protein